MPCSKKVFVTGATGLIGKELLKPLIKAGFDVFALTIEDNNPAVSGVHWIKGNLFDEAFIAQTLAQVQPSHLLNMAWCANGDYANANMNFDFVRAGLSLLKYFSQNGGKRAVFAGTCFEYAVKNESLIETEPLTDNTAYAYCKSSLWGLAQMFCRQNHISFGYGRIFYVYGRKEHPSRLTAGIMNALREGKPYEIKFSQLRRDYMYSKDIAGAFVKLLDSSVEGAVNICTGKAVSLAEYATALGNLLHRPDLLVLKQEETTQPLTIVGDCTRLTQELGFLPRYSLYEGLREIVEETR